MVLRAHAVDAVRFTFDESPIFVPGTTILLVHLTTLVVSLLKLQTPAQVMAMGQARSCAVCGWCYASGHF